MKSITIAASILALAAVSIPVAAQDLATVAAQPAVIADARTSPDGCAVRVLPDGGFMVFGTGSGTYSFSDEDDIAKARQAAQLAAKANLAKFMKEKLSTESALDESATMAKSISSKDGKTEKTIDKEMARKTMQTIRTSADALLKGVVTLSEAKVPNEGTGGEIRVVCGVSSKTLEARRRLGEALGERAAPVVEDGEASPTSFARKPIVRSTLPAVDILSVPDGVTVLVPPEGGFFVLSAATAAYDFGDPDDTLQAKRNAEAQAKAELAKFMKEKLATESAVDESANMVKSMSAKDGEEAATIDKNAARKTLQTIKTSADALLQGVATYADANIPGEGKSGEMRVLCGVSSKTMDALNQLENAWGVARPAAPAQTSVPAPQQVVAQTESVAQPGDDDWVECVGTGKSRPEAIRAALVEGVSMVYGTKLTQDNSVSIRFKSFQNNTANSALFEKKGASSTLSETAGFVRQYRVLAVKTEDGGLLEATVRAHVVNPRAKAIPAVFVAPMHVSLADKTKNFQVGPKERLSGGDLAKKLESELADALAAANRFMVLSGDSIDKTAFSGDLAKAMVEGGLAPATELLNACEASTADYVLGSALQDVKWTSKVGLDKSTGKFAPQRKLSIRAKVRLTDVRAARIVATEDLVASLDEEEIGMILGEDEDADLLFYALKKIAPSVEEWLASIK